MCPCPRCLIPLSHAPNLGMLRDMNQQKALARVDDIRRRSKVYTARRIIYKRCYQVNSAAMEALLKDESLVPASVHNPILLLIFLANLFIILPKCILRKVVTLWFQHVQDAIARYNA
jgi:hypothetical protein